MRKWKLEKVLWVVHAHLVGKWQVLLSSPGGPEILPLVMLLPVHPPHTGGKEVMQESVKHLL